MMGKYLKAISAYDQAIGVDPENSTAWYGKGLATFSTGKFRIAKLCYDAALRRDHEILRSFIARPWPSLRWESRRMP